MILVPMQLLDISQSALDRAQAKARANIVQATAGLAAREQEYQRYQDMLAKLELVGDNTSGLYQLDRQAASRAEKNEKS